MPQPRSARLISAANLSHWVAGSASGALGALGAALAFGVRWRARFGFSRVGTGAVGSQSLANAMMHMPSAPPHRIAGTQPSWPVRHLPDSWMSPSVSGKRHPANADVHRNGRAACLRSCASQSSPPPFRAAGFRARLRSRLRSSCRHHAEFASPACLSSTVALAGRRLGSTLALIVTAPTLPRWLRRC